ncbi:MAG: hypothetical protein JNM56_09260 [Planctomycetia bacterium]|nr:hypothetical protein [Planctomycetia bacterium]
MKKWLYTTAALLTLGGGHRAMAQAPQAVTTAPVVLNDQYIDYGADNCRRGSLIAEVGFMILTPKWKDNPAFFIDQFPGDRNLSNQRDFDFSQQFVPKLSLGFIGSGGLGARINWWGFASSRTESFGIPTPDPTDFELTPVGPLEIQEFNFLFADDPGDVIVARGKLRFDVWDFEAVDSFQAGNWSLLGSLGVRYVHISQRYDVDVLPGPPSVDTGYGSLRSGHNFNGAGPTVSLDGRRMIGNSSLFLYGNGRASVLFGDAKQDAHAIGGFDDPSSFTMQAHAVVAATELEVGAGWARDMGRMRVSAKAGFVGQVWFDAGNSARATGNDNADMTGPQDGNLGLVGWTLNLGIGY